MDSVPHLLYISGIASCPSLIVAHGGSPVIFIISLRTAISRPGSIEELLLDSGALLLDMDDSAPPIGITMLGLMILLVFLRLLS